MNGVARRIANGGKTPTGTGDAKYDIVIVGGGTGGISVASSLRHRQPDLDIAIIDPAEIHYYQPGWTMVGGGVFKAEDTARTIVRSIPSSVKWIKAAVAAFEPENDAVILDGCRVVKYDPPYRLSGPQTRLGRRRGARRDARAKRRHLELPLRSRAHAMGAGAVDEGRPRDLPQPPCRSNAPVRLEGDVFVGRCLVPPWRPEGYRHSVQQRGRCAVRCEGLRARADAICREVRRHAELLPRSDRHRRSGEDGERSRSPSPTRSRR